MKKILGAFVIALAINAYFNPACAQGSQQEMMRALLPQIEYALSCNSSWGSISEVEPIDLTIEHNQMIVKGHYKETLIIKGVLSGAFQALFDNKLKLTSIYYKISFKQGKVKDGCL